MTSAEIKKILNRLGRPPIKLRGQNFLIDQKALADLVAAAELKKIDTVLEIGPGLGGLTEKLLEQAGWVVAVELDSVLFNYLRQIKFQNFPSDQVRLHLIQGDAREFDPKKLLVLGAGQSYKLVANIPYYLTSDILEKFLREKPCPQLLVLLVQKEVAERIVARPPKMNRLAIFVQYFGQPEIIRPVSKNAFWPRPKVDSAILRLRQHPLTTLALREQKLDRTDFFRLVARGFAHPRRKLIRNLEGIFNQDRSTLVSVFKRLGLSLNSRPGELDFLSWFKLAQSLPNSTFHDRENFFSDREKGKGWGMIIF